jgi:hypothetical protein
VPPRGARVGKSASAVSGADCRRRRLRSAHPHEPLCFVAPDGHGPDDVFTGRDPIWKTDLSKASRSIPLRPAAAPDPCFSRHEHWHLSHSSLAQTTSCSYADSSCVPTDPQLRAHGSDARPAPPRD